MGSWTEADQTALDLAMTVARGVYQRHLLEGTKSLSGSTLRGRAATYRGRYRASAVNLLDRVRKLGVWVGDRRGDHGKIILVLSAEPLAKLVRAVEQAESGSP